MKDDDRSNRGPRAGSNGIDPLSRRDLLQIGVGAALAAPLAGVAASPGFARAAAQALAAGRFLSADEMSLLDELTEMIIPADAHSGGARAAGVVAFIDRTLSEKSPSIEDYARERKAFKDGLVLVEELTRSMHDCAFLEATPEQRLSVLERMAQNEGDPKTPEEEFFATLKRTTAYAYYTSEVGIHEDLGYLGNTVLREFVGTDVSKG